VLVDDLSISQSAAIRESIEKVAREQFDIDHATLQMECLQCSPGDVFCNLKSKPGDKKDGEL
jgi:cobalt-zinc-cadmium efflux system protein